MKNKERASGRNSCQKRPIQKLLTDICCGGVYKHTGNVDGYITKKLQQESLFICREQKIGDKVGSLETRTTKT